MRMSEKEIDELFEMFQNDDLEAFMEKYGGSYKNMPIDEINENIIYEIYKNIMQKIEQGNYEYFTTKRDNKETIKIYIELMSGSSKKDDFKEFAKDCLTLEKISELELDSDYITELIKATGKIEEYLTLDKIIELKLYSNAITKLIKATGKIERYLTREKISELPLNSNCITELIKETGKIEKYLLEGQDKEDENLSFNILNVLKGSEDNKNWKIIEKLMKKNSNLHETLVGSFVQIMKNKTYNLNEEQLLRITNYRDVQEFLVSIAENETMKKSVDFLINNDDNWIISLSRIIDNKKNYDNLITKLNNENIKNNEEEFMNQLLFVLSDRDNYFDVNDENDIRGYFAKKKDICIKILKGEISEEEIPANLKEKKYSKEELYKFALLEYKLGISLEETKRLVARYAEDIEKINEMVQTNDKLNKYSTTSEYFYILKEILDCENIEELINEAVQKDTLGETWDVPVNSRNIEAQMLNLFAEIYNETLYKPKEEEKSKKQEIYIEEKDGSKIEQKIDVYNLTDDFNINIRVEGAYRDFEEPNNFEAYYNQPNITDHGNCESYIGNDLIAVARNDEGVAVGYSMIGENCLVGSAPYDIGSFNIAFSIFNEENENINSQFLLTKSMKDNTRHTHNEMIKERIIIDEEGNAIKYKPNYAIWVEETPIQERDEKWQEEKEKNSKWIMTKKLAAQLGIPIIVIDREYYAQREEKKVEILKNLILEKEDNLTEEETYNSFIEEYKNVSKPELIKELFTKYENNRVGLQFNEDLCKTYFTQASLENKVNEIQGYIENTKDMSDEEKKKCIQTMLEVAFKEENAIEIPEQLDSSTKERKKKMREFYAGLIEESKEKLYKIEQSKQSEQQIQKSESKTITQNEPQNYIDYINIISKTNFYEGNEHHSIEHIQKVILFSELLAQGEGISEKDKKLLLVAAAYHDSGRQGLGDGRVLHAEQSAKKTGEVLQGEGPTFGITDKKDIAMIQTAIEYHECKDKTDGKVDEDKIKEIAMKYAKDNGVDQLDIERTITICKILKDADALDRYRFAKNGTLNPKLLRTETAQNTSVQAYAKNINEMVARKILVQICGIDPEEIENGRAVESLKGKYAKTYDKNVLAKIYDKKDIEEGQAYIELSKARGKNIREGCPRQEDHLDFTEIYSMLFPDIQKEENRSKTLRELLRLYGDRKITHQGVNQSKKDIKRDIQQIEQGQNTIDEQSYQNI